VLIVADTLRRDHVGVYGGSVPTPHMDALARDGMVFRNAVASFHSTPTSMGALFTGLTPSLESGQGSTALAWNRRTWCGMARFSGGRRDACLPRGLTILPEALDALGYSPIGVTANPLLLRPAGFDDGFAVWLQVEADRRLAFGPDSKPRFAAGRAGDLVNEKVSAALDRRSGDRLFLYVHYLDVHDYHLARVPYAEAVAKFDAVLGALLAILDARGLRKGAAIVLTSDHGESLGGEMHFQQPRGGHAGNPSFETVLRVPLIVSGARLAWDEDALVRTEDVFRMLVRLAGGEPPDPADLRDDEHLVGERRYRTYRQGRWKSFWPRGGEPPRLVDLSEDPLEQHDLAASHADVLAAHRERVEELSRRLATDADMIEEVAPEQRRRLEALGYLEGAYDLDRDDPAPPP
jgi:arylsulfatase A-like enzyme